MCPDRWIPYSVHVRRSVWLGPLSATPNRVNQEGQPTPFFFRCSAPDSHMLPLLRAATENSKAFRLVGCLFPFFSFFPSRSRRREYSEREKERKVCFSVLQKLFVALLETRNRQAQTQVLRHLSDALVRRPGSFPFVVPIAVIRFAPITGRYTAPDLTLPECDQDVSLTMCTQTRKSWNCWSSIA